MWRRWFGNASNPEQDDAATESVFNNNSAVSALGSNPEEEEEDWTMTDNTNSNSSSSNKRGQTTGTAGSNGTGSNGIGNERSYTLDEFLLHFYLYSFTTRYNEWAWENREEPLRVHQLTPPALNNPRALRRPRRNDIPSNNNGFDNEADFDEQEDHNNKRTGRRFQLDNQFGAGFGNDNLDFGANSNNSNSNNLSRYNSSYNSNSNSYNNNNPTGMAPPSMDSNFGSHRSQSIADPSTLPSPYSSPSPRQTASTTSNDLVDKQVHAMAAQIAPDLYLEIDNFAKQSSFSSQSKLQTATLARYLTQSKPNLLLSPEQKARAIFTWIAHNIDYNVRAYLNGKFSDAARDPEQVLSVRSAICEGFSRLFHALIQAAGVVSPDQVVVIAGQARVLGGIRQGQLEPHAWNAIVLNGQWRLIDVTWAAGYLDSSQFVKRFSDGGHWLADPLEFAHTHLPNDPKWQLLPSERIVTRQTMERLPLASHLFFSSNIQLLSHNSCTIVHSSSSGRALEITISVPKEDLYLMAQLRLLTPQGAQLLENRTLVQQQTGSSTHWKILVAFPPGSASSNLYSVQIMGQLRTAESNPDNLAIGATSMYHNFIEYLCSRPTPCNFVFPQQMDDFLKRPGTELLTPTTGILNSRAQNQLFSVRVPGAIQVGVCRMNGTTNSWSFLTPGADHIYEGTINISVPCEYVVGARFAKSRKSDNMYRLLLRYVSQ